MTDSSLVDQPDDLNEVEPEVNQTPPAPEPQSPSHTYKRVAPVLIDFSRAFPPKKSLNTSDSSKKTLDDT